MCTLVWFVATKDPRLVPCSSRSLGPSPRRPTTAVCPRRSAATAFAHRGCIRFPMHRSLLVLLPHALYVSTTRTIALLSIRLLLTINKDRIFPIRFWNIGLHTKIDSIFRPRSNNLKLGIGSCKSCRLWIAHNLISRVKYTAAACWCSTRFPKRLQQSNLAVWQSEYYVRPGPFSDAVFFVLLFLYWAHNIMSCTTSWHCVRHSTNRRSFTYFMRKKSKSTTSLNFRLFLRIMNRPKNYCFFCKLMRWLSHIAYRCHTY